MRYYFFLGTRTLVPGGQKVWIKHKNLKRPAFEFGSKMLAALCSQSRLTKFLTDCFSTYNELVGKIFTLFQQYILVVSQSPKEILVVDPQFYRTIDGFFQYYRYATEHILQRYQILQQQYGLMVLDQWLIEADSVTEHLLNEACEYGLTVNQALAPIAFMDDWIRYGFPFVKRYSDEYEEVWLPVHLFSQTHVDITHNPKQVTGLILLNYAMSIELEEECAYSNDWYVVLIRKIAQPGKPGVEPFYEISNDLIKGSEVKTQKTFLLDQYMNVNMETYDAFNKPYNDPFGIRTQLLVKACRLKALSKSITVKGETIMDYKNTSIGYNESGVGYMPVQVQKAIFVLMLLQLPVITSTFVIV